MLTLWMNCTRAMNLCEILPLLLSTILTKMSLQPQLRRIPQLIRQVEKMPHRGYIARNLQAPNVHNPRFSCEEFSQLATTSTTRHFCSRTSFGTQSLASSLNWKTLGVISFAGLALHTWLQSEAYALDTEFPPAETEKSK
jgi:hypothetical protein